MTLSNQQIEELLRESRALSREGLDEQNEILLRKALSHFPDHPELLVQTAAAISRTAPDEAKGHLRRAVQLSPDEPGILFCSASLMFSLGEISESRDYAHRARARAGADFPLLVDLIHLAGKLADQKGNYEDAEKALTIAFDEEPCTLGHGRVLAEFYVRRGRLVEALDVVSRAQHHLPEDEALRELRDHVMRELNGHERE